MASSLGTRRPSSRSLTHGWRCALLTPFVALAAAPAAAGEAGICNAANTLCSVYVKAEHGHEYSNNAPDSLAMHPDIFFIKYEMGQWSAYNEVSATTSSVTWGPASTTVTPFAGDWDGNGYEGVGIAYPTENGTRFVTANLHTTAGGGLSIFTRPGFYDIPEFGTPIIGDWDGDGIDSVGVYDDGVFTVVNNPASDGTPQAPIQMDLSALIPAGQSAIAQPIKWPWLMPQEATDYIGLALDDKIVAINHFTDGYVHVVTRRPVGILELSSTFDPTERPVVLEPSDPTQRLLGGFLRTPSFGNPDDDEQGVRPGDGSLWFP